MTPKKLQFIPVSAQAATRLLLVAAGVVALNRWADLGETGSIGRWFTSLLLFGAGLLTILTGRLVATGRGRWNDAWPLLGLGCLVLSFDEVAGLRSAGSSLAASAHWAALAGAFVLLPAAAFAPLLRSLPPRTRWAILVAGAVYLAGTSGVASGTLHGGQDPLLIPLTGKLLKVVEEFLEMAGVILFMRALLSHIEVHLSGAAVWLELGAGPSRTDQGAGVHLEASLPPAPRHDAAKRGSSAA